MKKTVKHNLLCGLAVVAVFAAIAVPFYLCVPKHTPFPPYKFSLGETVEVSFGAESPYRRCVANENFGIEDFRNYYKRDAEESLSIKSNAYKVRISCGNGIQATVWLDESELKEKK
jgi:hypothetical protein